MDNLKEQLQELRDYTNQRAGLSECMKALRENGGDMEKAKAWLLEKGFAQKRKALLSFPVPDGAPSKWVYMASKAQLYLEIGPEIYRRDDAFDMPDPEWDEEILDAIEICFRQLVEGTGLSREQPMVNVGIRGFNAAMATLHFEVVSQSAFIMETEEAFLDKMDLRHWVDGEEITLYNRVDYPEDYFED